MSTDVDAGVAREVAGEVFYPIANAIFHAANPQAGELSAQSDSVQNHWIDVAVVACADTFATLAGNEAASTRSAARRQLSRIAIGANDTPADPANTVRRASCS
jgi:hypothetical protein